MSFNESFIIRKRLEIIRKKSYKRYKKINKCIGKYIFAVYGLFVYIGEIHHGR